MREFLRHVSLLIAFGLSISAYATIYTSVANGPFNITTNWDAAGRPPTASGNQFNGAHTANINTTITSNIITNVGNGFNFVINNGGVLNITNQFIVKSGSSIVVKSGGTLSVSSSFALNSGASLTVESGGTLIVGGVLDPDDNDLNFLTGSTVTVGGISGTYGTPNYVFNGNINITGDMIANYSSLTIGSSGSLTVGQDWRTGLSTGNTTTILGNVSIGRDFLNNNPMTLTQSAGSTFNVARNWTNSSGTPSTISLNGATNIFGQFEPRTALTIGTTGDVYAQTFYNNGTYSTTVSGNLEVDNFDVLNRLQLTINPTGNVKINDNSIDFQGVNINNNGTMNFTANPITFLTSYGVAGYAFDCDGSTNLGVVTFVSPTNYCTYCTNLLDAGCFTNVPLPVEFAFFDVEIVDSKYLFNWSTYKEINNDKFVLEYSIDALTFYPLSTISGKGNSSTINYYSATSELVNFGGEVIYFRLKQIDFDGTESFSRILAKEHPNQYLYFYPNPAKDFLNIVFVDDIDTQEILVEIHSLTENYFVVVNGKLDLGRFRLDVSNLQEGVYIISIPALNKKAKLTVEN
jgi:hypothetical protein